MASKRSDSVDLAATAGPGRAVLARSQEFAVCFPARILVVEDMPLNQKITCMLLQRLGYTEIDFAGDGLEAVQMMGGGEYDLVFMDLLMPGMGGIDATVSIRGNLWLPRQPFIIATTGHALTEIRDECFEVGMNAFLAKPASLEDFRQAIQSCLEKRTGA